MVGDDELPRHWIIYSLVFIHNKAPPPGSCLWCCLAKNMVRSGVMFYIKLSPPALVIQHPVWVLSYRFDQSIDFMSFLNCKFNFRACFITQLSIKQSIKLKPTTKSCNKIKPILSVVCVPCHQVICKTTESPTKRTHPHKQTQHTSQLLINNQSIYNSKI